MSGMSRRFSRLAAAVVVAVATLALAAAPPALAQPTPFEDIHSSGPLSDIWISQDLSCQVAHAGNGIGEFYPGGAGPADCGTFLSLVRNSKSPVLYSPQFEDNAGGSAAHDLGRPFARVSQTFSGSGTSANPYTVTTAVKADDGGVTLTEVDSYVVGDDFYSTTVTLRNTGHASFSGVLYHAGDCLLRGFDTGFGASLSGTEACTINPDNSPPSALEAFVPSTGGSHSVETAFPTIWLDDVDSGRSLPNGCDCTVQEDNAMGISWSFAKLSSWGRTFSWRTRIDDPPIAATGGQTFTGRAPLTVNGTIATISDSDTSTSSGDYTATVDWGDGSSDRNPTITGRSGSFSIADHHTYTTPGAYTIKVTVSYASNPSFSAVATDEVNIGAAPAPPPPAVAAPASVTTASPTFTGARTADFSGSANPEGSLTTVHFEYGLDPKYSGGGPVVYTASTPDQTIGSDFTIHTFSASVSGLVPNALYHVRLVATNSAGTTLGPDVSFTTPSAPAPGSPTIGKSFNISPVSGVVLIRINGRLVPLTQLRPIPAGALIDALHGTLRVTTATGGHPAGDAAAKVKKGKKGKTATQTGTFGGAIFRISQVAGGPNQGLTTLAIVEGAFKGAPSFALLCTKHKAADATIASSRRTLQLLRASAKGRFRTRGRYSAATVLGTQWTVADRCDGTLTHDITDSVKVTDFVHHKTIVLHAGQSYLAKRGR
jgi:hypothetical protein